MVRHTRFLLESILCAFPAVAFPATLRVDLGGAGDFTAIQPALDAAAAGDTVLVAPGEYVIAEPLCLNRLHDPLDPSSPPAKDLTLRSEAGPSETVVRIDAADPARASVLVFQHGESRASTVVGFRLTGGKGTRRALSAASLGGGILCVNGSSPTLRDVTVLKNEADFGGGLYCDDSSAPTFSSATFRRNRAAGEGGGVFAGGDLRISNSVIAENFAASEGGILSLHSQLEVIHCTIVGNASETGVGGVYCGGMPCQIESSILWSNGEEPSCRPGDDNLVSTDPLVPDPGVFDFARFRSVEIAGTQHALPDFILVEPDYRLTPASPAIDAVSPKGLPPDDFAGHARPCGLAADLGAFEMGECAPPGAPFVRGDVDGDGKLGLADGIVTLEFLFRGGPAPACRESADVTDSGRLDIADPVYELMHLFVGGAPPPAPFPECGIDPTADPVPCSSFGACGT